MSESDNESVNMDEVSDNEQDDKKDEDYSVDEDVDADLDADLDEEEDDDNDNITNDPDDEDNEGEDDIGTNNEDSSDKPNLNETENSGNNPFNSNVNINLGTNVEIQDEDYESSDDEYDGDEYLQKFDKDVTNNYIVDVHQDCIIPNHDEIVALSNVTRNKENIIIDDLHRTIPILSKYEKTKILGLRAKQINDGAMPYITVTPNDIDGYTIAKKELYEKKMPFIIRRPLPNGCSEYWKIKDLEII